MPPRTSHLINGIVYDIYGIALEGASVSIVHTNGTLTATTNSTGQYTVNLSSLSSWTRGDSLSITANKTGEGSKTIETTISSGGGQTQHLTLEEEEQVEGMDSESRAKINKVILISYDKRDINRSNALPVQIIDSSDYIDLVNNPSTVWTITRGDGQPDSETVTMAKGDIYKRTFTYTNNILTARSKWAKQ